MDFPTNDTKVLEQFVKKQSSQGLGLYQPSLEIQGHTLSIIGSAMFWRSMDDIQGFRNLPSLDYQPS